ncbi:hypothetical protein AMTRI_Chr03g53250 [Amborella trichopoda]
MWSDHCSTGLTFPQVEAVVRNKIDLRPMKSITGEERDLLNQIKARDLLNQIKAEASKSMQCSTNSSFPGGRPGGEECNLGKFFEWSRDRREGLHEFKLCFRNKGGSIVENGFKSSVP